MNRLPVIALALLSLATTARGELKASLDSLFVVIGEESRLLLTLDSREKPLAAPAAPKVDGLSITAGRSGMQRGDKGEIIQFYPFAVRCFNPGRHTIPAFTVNVGGQIFRSQPIVITAFPVDQVEWDSVTIFGRDIGYGTALFAPQDAPYAGQTFPVEVKVYLPSQLANARSGFAQLDQDGVAAWRFEPSQGTSNVHLRGRNHNGVTFRSTATPLRDGPFTLGPGKARINLQVLRSERGITIWQSAPADLQLPARSMTARALPPGAPANFDGAVGQFELSALGDTSNLEEGDPISLRLTVSGTGNLDTLQAPKLVTPEGEWKAYEPSRLERRGERRDVTGSVSFSQIIRPLLAQREIPPFELAYFDPLTAQYRTARTKPIPFTLIPTKKSPGALPIIPDLTTPVEEMQGILGLVDPLRSAGRAGSNLAWTRYWHLLPGLLGLLLLARLAQRHLLPRFRKSSREREILKALANVENAAPQANDFLRAAGHFVEAWIPEHRRDDELEAILTRRDEECFRRNPVQASLEQDERRGILATLRDRALAAAPLIVLLAALLPAPRAAAANPAATPLYQQAEAAWSEGNYRAALEFYHKAHPETPRPADIEFNIGNCHFQLGEPGRAALHYRRALLADPRHPEARQNLRFLERRLGTITIHRRPYEDNLALLPLRAYTTTLAASLWTTALSLLALFALTSRPLRNLAWTGLIAGPALAVAAGACLYYYPSDTEAAPLEELAVVTSNDRIAARTEASTTGQLVIEIPPGSVGRLLAPRQGWSYLELANGTRGWLPSDQVELLTPSPQSPPPTPSPGT